MILTLDTIIIDGNKKFGTLDGNSLGSQWFDTASGNSVVWIVSVCGKWFGSLFLSNFDYFSFCSVCLFFFLLFFKFIFYLTFLTKEIVIHVYLLRLLLAKTKSAWIVAVTATTPTPTSTIKNKNKKTATPQQLDHLALFYCVQKT